MADPLDQTLMIHLTVAEAREVLTPLVKDLRGIALSGKKYHYTQVSTTDEIVDDMVKALWAKSEYDAQISGAEEQSSSEV